jgi:transcriptional regulatory protein LEU3
MILAGFTILKISKCPIAPFLGQKDGERPYFATIVFLRKSSLENDDLYARGAMILTQLRTSHRIFKAADGTTNSLSLRIRTRLAMSVVFDCFWWWREEFQGKPSPFRGLEDHSGKGNSYIPIKTDV